jgi:hypothetical protein
MKCVNAPAITGYLTPDSYSLNSDTVLFVKDEIGKGSKGTQHPLRAYAMASSGNFSSPLTPEG